MGAQGAACAASLRLACQPGSLQQKNAFHYNFDDMNNKTALVQNLAGFLLMVSLSPPTPHQTRVPP